jgi:serine/threonine-protein kinase
LPGLWLLAIAASTAACVTADAPEQGDGDIASTSSELTGGPWPWTDAATNLCLDSNASGAVYAQGCNGGSYQKWTNRPGSYAGDTLTNLATGFCLDSNASGSVYALPCNGGVNQQWVVSKVSAGWQLLNSATARCLDSNPGGAVYTLPCNGGNYQHWY